MDATIRSRSIIISVAIHAALFLILLFVMVTTQIPPFPETGGGGGVIVNIGYIDEASGDVQPMSDNITENPALTKVKPASQPDENIATQDIEESGITKEIKDPKKTDIKRVNTTVTAPRDDRKVVEPVKTVDQRSIYKGKSNNSSSQGTGKGTGDQGDPTGDPNSKYYGKNGSGNGGPGVGPGEGPGQGPGKGGISFSLAGRKMIRTPQINDRSQETGKVVVDITVDKNGEVTAAIPGGRGSTTTSSYLYRLAREAAMKAKFNAGPEDADIQKGTITFVFLVQ
ncbi:MAG: energy transducer TonB [Bacteroidetes bacterium]|nr:energy transducer TonB [Bacteroidota bacterium]MBK9543870.1 energy transducer TonB [Bacteroidota bacterium]MBP6649555.1 energy transducer TonB [Bacteroidia bacterium]